MHVVAGVDDPYEHDSLAAASPHVSVVLFASHPADCYKHYCEHVGVYDCQLMSRQMLTHMSFNV